MSSPSINHVKLSQAAQPVLETIERKIPGSNIEITFIVENEGDKAVVQATVKINTETARTIPNVPIEAFPNNSATTLGFNDALKMLRNRALDYICGSIIFLPGTPVSLFEEWNKQKSTNGRVAETEKNPREYVKKLKKAGSVLKDVSKESTKKVVDAYKDFGHEYLCSSKYREALLLYQHMFARAFDSQDKEGLLVAHHNLGIVYFKMGETERAIAHYEQDLSLSQQLGGRVISQLYCNLGDIYLECGDAKKAVEYYKKFLENTLRLNFGMEIAYYCLGNAYKHLGGYAEAEYLFKKSLQISETSGALNGLGGVYMRQGYYKRATVYFEKALEKTHNQSDKGVILHNLGPLSECLGRYREAQNYYEQAIVIFKAVLDCQLEARTLCDLGSLRLCLRDDTGTQQIIQTIESLLPFLKNRKLEGEVFRLKGDWYRSNSNSAEAVVCYEKYLVIAAQNEDYEGQMNAYRLLAKTYYSLMQFEAAIRVEQLALDLAIAANDSNRQAFSLGDLGYIYHLLGNSAKAVELCRSSINIHSILYKENCQNNLQWQISLFDAQYRPYRLLEQMTLKTSEEEALFIADASRARALVGLLEKKSDFFDGQKFSLDKMKEAAVRFQTMIVLYSCDPFDDKQAWCWVISPKDEVIFQELKITDVAEAIPSAPANDQVPLPRGAEGFELRGKKLQKEVSEWITGVEKEACRGSDEPTSEPPNFEQLQRWHRDFIAPIEHLLPKNGERVTFVPDAFLHDLPFALFQDVKGKYLFETCTPITVPSIETLLRVEELSQKNRSSRNLKNICILTNPNPNQNYGLPPLEGVIEEGQIAAKFFDLPSQSTPKELKKKMGEAGHIHLACHGLADEKENELSVFEGALDMTDHLLYTEDIVTLPLNAELVFLSACHSGKGRVYREGAVGLPFAFLAGGVSSVIATRWRIFDKATPKIVEEFYRHYRGESKEAKKAQAEGKPFGQAEGLRAAMLFAKERYPTKPQIWGAFFLTGLPGNLSSDEAMNKLAAIDAAEAVWEDAESGIHFSLRKGIVTIKHRDGREFSEDKIWIQMTSFDQMRQGHMQKECQLSSMTSEQKTTLIKSLSKRKMIVKVDRIIICAEH